MAIYLFQAAYRTNPNVRKTVLAIKALPFVPVKDVIYAFNYIWGEASNEMIPIFEYIEKNYIGRRVGNGTCRQVPRFPIDTWNVHGRLNENICRTNNNVESWNKHFSVSTCRSELGVYSTV